MKKHKRTDDPAWLEQEIDRLRLQQKNRSKLADDLDASADEIFKNHGDATFFTNTKLSRAERIQERRRNKMIRAARRLRERATRIRTITNKSSDRRIRHLSLKLAELKTATLPGLLPDNSVSV